MILLVFFVLSIPGVKSIDLRLDKTEVPNTETNYYCQSFTLPSDDEYHIIGHEGIVDNDLVVHHMLLYACDEHESKKHFILLKFSCKYSLLSEALFLIFGPLDN